MTTESLAEEDDLLQQHSLNIDDLLRDSEFPVESPLNLSGGLLGGSPNSIWAADCGLSPASNEFLSYNGLSNGYHNDVVSSGNHWSTYGVGHSDPFRNASPSKDETLTAPLSQSESEAGSDHSWRFEGCHSVDFGQATIEGAHRYAEALTQWNTVNGDVNGVYDPFKSCSVIDDLNGAPLRRSQSANTRPTFADVAKKPSSPGSEPPPTPSLSSDGLVYESEESLNSLQEKKVKPRVFRPAHPRHGGYHVPLPINPDSKYGLDDFEVQESCLSKLERSFSCNDALDRSAPATARSSCENVTNEEPASTASKDRASPTTKTSTEWFDPRRIFQNGGARVRSESVPCDTVLNNNITTSK